jgi:surface protein
MKIPLTGTGLSVTVDWGNTITNSNLTHTYAVAGSYTVSVTITAGTNIKLGGGDWGTNGSLVSLNSFGTANFTSFESIFQNCSNLTSVPNSIPITVLSLKWAFNSATSFNHSNIVSWNTVNITDMYGAFQNANQFNQPIGNWNTSNVTNMSHMFYITTSTSNFDQNLGNWNVSKVADFQNFLQGNTSMSLSNFNSLLTGWASRAVLSGKTLDASLLKYSVDAQNAYTTLTTAPKNWTITATFIRQNPTITFNNITKNYGDASFTPSPSSNSDAPFTFTTSDTNVAIVSGTTIIIVGVGSCTITAQQQENSSYYSGVAYANLMVDKNNKFAFMYPQGMNFSTTSNKTFKVNAFNVVNPNDAIVYRTSIPMPAGIIFNKNTGEISGKPKSPFGTIKFTISSDSTKYTYSARDVSITCNQ